jgi:GST-like protein
VDKPIVVYGAKGSGSVAVEAALTLIGRPYDVVEARTWEGDEQRARVEQINPMRQVPALLLPSGEALTESAAILMWLAEQHPKARLAPPPGDPRRAAFLRWMSFVSASIYSLYWIRDDPLRLAADAEAGALVKARTTERIAECWRLMESQMSPGRYLLGEDLSVLDLYVTVVSRWGPRRERFYREAPRMAEVVRRIDQDPRLAAFWAERFPFEGAYSA